MSWPLALALLGLAAALVQRWRRAHGGAIDLEGATLQLGTGLGLVGLLATGLALAGRFGPVELVVGVGLAAVALWPWRTREAPRRVPTPVPTPRFVIALVLLLGGLALRVPQIPSPLAGRDQGTYTLRAQHTLREGGIAFSVPLLEQESEAAPDRPGPADVLGLHHRSDEEWRRGLYETSYRPGFYLVERERGRVVPQFFHVHPTLMAVSGALLGPAHVGAIVLLEALLALLALYAIARRLWPVGPWAELALAMLALSPLSIWVGRVALTESLTAGFFACAVLCALRSRDGDAALLLRAALLFGLTAWVRGNAWLTAPFVMGVLLLRPRVFRPGRGALLTLSALLLGSVAVHATTCFPYIYDELHRLLPKTAQLHPSSIVGGAVLVVLLVIGADLGLTLGLRRPPRRVLRALGHAPKLLAAIAVAGAGLYLGLRWNAPAKPFSRLDPAPILIGLPTIALAGVGLFAGARAWRPRWRQTDVWLLALACVPVLTLALYARRNLPQGGLYYYARYLVPELLPAAILLAVFGLEALHTSLHPRFGRVATGVGILLAGVASWTQSGVLITDPHTRLREFAGAGRIVDALAAHTEPDAIVIAGGEGWHHGHTYNQVAGALAVGRGRTVLPYVSREATYATLFELLVARPEATGEPAPPIYLLINEASHAYTREDDAIVAGIDDGLPPPFRASDATLLELYTDRLTPVTDAVPTRVTRDVLRMGLLRVDVDPEAPTREWGLAGESAAELSASGLKVEGPHPVDGHWCLHPKRPRRVTLPAGPSGPGSLVVVAEAGAARDVDTWKIRVDDQPLALRAPGDGRRERDTLGPFPRTEPPTTVEIRGSRHARQDAQCPHGAIFALRWLGPDTSALAPLRSESALTLVPPVDLGHPVRPAHWVSARAVSRYRPGTHPEPELHALSLVLRPRKPLGFTPVFSPATGDEGLADIVVTLTGTALSPEARIVMRLNGREVARLDPPDASDRSWQSTVLRVPLDGATTRIELELAGDGDPEHYARVRDVAVFGIVDEVTSQPAP